MKATICFCSINRSFNFTTFLRAALLFLLASTMSASLFAQATITWKGAGTLFGSNTQLSQDLNNPLNWDALKVPTATDNVVISLTGGSILNLTGNLTIGNLTLVVLHENVNNPNNNNNPNYINVGAFTLKVNGNTTMDISDDHPNNRLYVGVTDGSSSAGTMDFVGNVVVGTTDVRDGVVFTGNPNSTIICRSNLTLNIRAQVEVGSEPGTLLFDGTGTQTIFYNNAKNCGFRNITVGQTNSPTLVIAGTSTPDNIVGNITVANNAVLDLNTRQLNRKSNGGSLFLKNTATLKVGGLSSTSNSGSASLIPGSNFPSGFTNIVLDSTSTVEFYGTNQSIPGAAHLIKGYGNLTLINNTKTLISSFAMFRNLTIAPNTTMALGNFDDTLKSNNVTTAYVSAVPSNATISYGTNGGFVVERFLQAYKSWRLLATPVDIATSPTFSAAWRENNAALTSTGFGTQITGPQGPSTASSTAVLDVYTQRGSVKYFNAATDNYIEIGNANTTKIANKEGYYVFVRGDRGVPITGAAGKTNLRIKGRIRTGDQSFTVPTGKFASVGNPFPSRIDFRTIYNSSISPSYYVWNPNPNGTFYNAGKYEVYVNYGDGNYRLGNPAGPIRNFIESGQAVFIQTISGANITIKESDKFGGSSVVSRGTETGRQGVNNPTLEINLRTRDGNGEDILADAAVLNFNAAFSNGLDNMDVRKISNTSDNLSIKIGNVNLVLDRKAGLTATDTIFLNLSNTRISNYRFNIDPSMLAYPTLKAFMVDKFLKNETELSLTAATDYAFAITADAASRASDRFMIIFKSVSPAVFTAIKAVRNDDNTIAVTWNMSNENNINNYSIERSLDGGVKFTAFNNQMPTANNFGSPYYTVVDAAVTKQEVLYRVKANNISNTSFYSDQAIAAKVVDVNTKNAISIYPNPIVNGIVNLYFNNQTAGKYTVSIVNSKGEQVKNEVVNVNNNAVAETVAINDAAAGMYRAIVTDAKGKATVIPFVKL